MSESVGNENNPAPGGLFAGFAQHAAEQAKRNAELVEWRADMEAAQNSSVAPEAERPPVEWSSQQQAALDRIKNWYLNSTAQIFYLTGPAGSGKTTLTKAVKDTLGICEVKYATVTGKAASVMEAKGCAGATTIHRLIYQPRIEYSCRNTPPCGPASLAAPPCGQDRCVHRREEPVGWTLNEKSSIREADLVILDEVSMVGQELGNALLSFDKRMLVLGDMAQLPHMDDWDTGFFTNRTPDFELTDIHRQALGSPVIQLATAVRNGNNLRLGRYGDSIVAGGLTTADLLLHDQIIVGTHKKRAEVNARIRQMLGFHGDIPQIGERVLCERNDHTLSLLNGTIWTVLKVVPDRYNFVDMTVKSDDGRVIDVVAPIPAFHDTKNAGKYSKNPFTFAYAITCHKAQGSQWRAVCVFNESGYWREDRFRWLYTAVTRAADRVTVTRG
jgi:exodeoxyribonuclease-5